jgi:DNA-binding response OmpR family regulator
MARAAHRVLVVEDEWMLALAIAALLRGMGCEVIGPVGRVAEATEVIANPELDAAILDLNLNGELSYSLASQLQRRGCPFLFLTGYDPGAVPKEFAGVTLLEKPFTDAELVAGVEAMLARRDPAARTAAGT